MTDVPSDPAAEIPVPAAAAPAVEVDEAAEFPVGGDQIIGMSFDKVTRAEEVLLALVHLQQEGEIAMADAVIATKGDDGRVHIHQTIDPTPGVSALRGSFWGALVGAIIGGPVFLAGALVGAGSGALMAKLVDLGLDDRWVKQVGEWLDPGTSALLLLVSQEVRPAVVKELGRYEGRVLYCTFPDPVRAELEAALGNGG
ncbi:MAG: DUF1269 domain-containing protein [Acidimicrobiales bacterium]